MTNAQNEMPEITELKFNLENWTDDEITLQVHSSEDVHGSIYEFAFQGYAIRLKPTKDTPRVHIVYVDGLDHEERVYDFTKDEDKPYYYATGMDISRDGEHPAMAAAKLLSNLL
jgi:hypothetical protein